MNKDWQTALHEFGNVLYGAFLLPGDFVLGHLPAQVPTLMRSLGIDPDGYATLPSAVLSLLFWLFVFWAGWRCVRLLRSVARYLRIAILARTYRIMLVIRVLASIFARTLHKVLPRRSPGGARVTAEVDFDDVDLAVLRTSAASQPGFTLSAPDIAAALHLRPGQVQQSLDKLRKYRMLDTVIGSSDGFDNYRLSQSGSAFLTSWLHQGPRT